MLCIFGAVVTSLCMFVAGVRIYVVVCVVVVCAVVYVVGVVGLLLMCCVMCEVVCFANGRGIGNFQRWLLQGWRSAQSNIVSLFFPNCWLSVCWLCTESRENLRWQLMTI